MVATSFRKPGRLAVDLVPVLAVLGLWTAGPAPVAAQEPDRLRDRGPGVPSSMFGTYIERGQLVLYPFYEYYRDHDAEYSPDELGFGLDQDFRGEYRAHEGLIFLGYGMTERLALELEAAFITARQDKSPEDPTAVPARIEESGLGDVESQLRFLWRQETDRRPAVFSYLETVFPLQKDRLLIGTRAWEFVLGSGMTRGFGFGTMTVRLSAAWEGDERALALAEYAVEYLRRVSPRLRVFAAVEGEDDEVELISEAQWFLRPNVFLKLNNAIGLTSKAADWAPEVGVMFSFR